MSPQVDRLLRQALEEDLGPGDVTTELTVDAGARARGVIRAKESLVLAGSDVAGRVFALVDEETRVTWKKADGQRARAGDVVATLQGPARAILIAERLALNLLQRLSGVATMTEAFVAAVRGTSARIVDTRKTTPGLRALEKRAVRAGGGSNHRFGLYDGILIKENHIAAAGGVRRAVSRARAGAPHGLKVEVEVTTLKELDQAIGAGADIVLLDNFAPDRWPAAVQRVGGRALVEISGGIDLERARVAAVAGADLISVGALTHSARAVDLSLQLDGPTKTRSKRRAQ